MTFNYVLNADYVESLSIELRISHSWVGDLDVVLKSPNEGRQLTLFSRTGATTEDNGGSPTNLDGSSTYVFSDTAAASWWTAAVGNVAVREGLTAPRCRGLPRTLPPPRASTKRSRGHTLGSALPGPCRYVTEQVLMLVRLRRQRCESDDPQALPSIRRSIR